ncbi:MAG: hypothetical protein NWE91_07145 [Candidatus Bathyarchaeota archaeon]|nr:hypothetical protein [Candidatus Bathyarchaeota archaeon]
MRYLTLDIIEKLRDVCDETLRMHRLNMELFETLHLTLLRLRDYAEKNNVPLDRGIDYLLHQVVILYEEITSKENFKSQKLPFIPSDEKKQISNPTQRTQYLQPKNLKVRKHPQKSGKHKIRSKKSLSGKQTISFISFRLKL